MERKRKNNNGGTSCAICHRWFASGKAMGGHMRVHLAKHPIPPKLDLEPPIADCMPSETSKVDVNGGSSSTDQSSISFPSPKSHMMMKFPTEQDFHLVNQDFAARISNLSNKKGGILDRSYISRRRSKRHRKIDGDATRALMSPSNAKLDEDSPNQTGSIFDSDALAKDAALTLVLLSKEKWPKGEELIKKKQIVKDADEQEESSVEVHSHDGRFVCEICRKVFRSYQALGGHKASHKRFIKNDQFEVDGEFDEENGDDGQKYVLKDLKVLKCPHCSKVFGSNQGLGRHKKVHFPNAVKSGAKHIDLNSPAPMEDY